MKKIALASFALFAGFSLSIAANAQAAPAEYDLIIKDHQFQPAELKVPAGQKIKLRIDNQDDSAEEFESHSLKREKVIPPKSKGVVVIGPLEAGSYEFVGEFHEDTAKGVIIAE